MIDEVTVSTKDRPGTFDAIETAKPGEPIFTLQGGDQFSPATICYWAQLARKHALTIENQEEARHLLTKASVAEQVAWAMQEYQRGFRPEERKAEIAADLAAVNADEERAAMARLSDKLYNAIAEVHDVREALRKKYDHGGSEAVAHCSLALNHIERAVAQIEPRRHLQRSPD